MVQLKKHVKMVNIPMLKVKLFAKTVKQGIIVQVAKRKSALRVHILLQIAQVVQHVLKDIIALGKAIKYNVVEININQPQVKQVVCHVDQENMYQVIEHNV